MNELLRKEIYSSFNDDNKIQLLINKLEKRKKLLLLFLYDQHQILDYNCEINDDDQCFLIKYKFQFINDSILTINGHYSCLFDNFLLDNIYISKNKYLPIIFQYMRKETFEYTFINEKIYKLIIDNDNLLDKISEKIKNHYINDNLLDVIIINNKNIYEAL